MGGVNTAFGFAAFAVFILLGLPKELAALLGTICGVLFNFKTTGTIVFKNKDNRLIFRFFGVYLVAYLLNIGLLDIFEIYSVGPLVAGAIIILPVSLLSFFLNRRFVFNTIDNTEKPGPASADTNAQMNRELPSNSPAMAQCPAKQDHFQRGFLRASAIVLTSIVILVVINLAIRAIVKNHLDQNVLDKVIFPPDLFVPEQVERTQYLVSLIAFPILCFVGWRLSNRLKVNNERWQTVLYPVVGVVLTIGISLWLYVALKKTDFLYVKGFSFLIPFFSLMLLIATYVERKYSPKWLALLLNVSAIGIVLFLFLAITCFSLFSRTDSYFTHVEFNAYFYSVAQVSRGETLLIDLTNQYGFYPYFLEPILRIVGLDIIKLTAVMGVLLASFFLILFFLIHRLVRSRVIKICAFLAVPGTLLWYLCTIGYDPYYQYWPHRVLLPGFLLLIVWFYQKASGRRKWILYCSAFVTVGIALLWNLETGLVAFGTWVLFLYWETLGQWISLHFKNTASAVVRHTLVALTVAILSIASLSIYTFLRSGIFPDLGAVLRYQSIFYGAGYYMLPMPLIHPWNLVILTYMAGIYISFSRLARKTVMDGPPEDQNQTSWYNMVFILSIMGAGLFSNYQGRSHDYNLLTSFWSAFLLIALFADSLLERFLHSFNRSPRITCRASNMTTGLLFLLVSLLLICYASGILGLFPKLASRIQTQAASERNMGEYDAISIEPFSPNQIHMDRFAATHSGNVDYIKVKCANYGSVKVALYADSAGTPAALLNTNDAGTDVKGGWNSIRLPSTPVIAGAYYWVAFNSSTACVAFAQYRSGIAVSHELTYSSSFPNLAGTEFNNSPVFHCLTAGWGAQDGGSRMLLGRTPYGFTESVNFIRDYFSPGDEVLILSMNQTAYYMESATANPLAIPGFAELILKSDRQKVVDYLLAGSVGKSQEDGQPRESSLPVRVIVGDDFDQFYPDLFELVKDNFRTIDQVNDLTLYEREQA